MDSEKIVGIIILIVLICSLIGVSLNSFVSSTGSKENISNNVLTEKDINLANNSSIHNVILNIHQNTGSVKIIFVNDSNNFYNISSKDADNSKTNVSYISNNETMSVDVNSDSSDNIIVLSNKYNYNINADLTAGGFESNITNYAKIDKLNVNINVGGIDLNMNHGKLNNADLNVNVGGCSLSGYFNTNSTITSNVNLGGTNININNGTTGVQVNSTIQLGDLNPSHDGYHLINKVDKNSLIQSDNWSISDNKVTININIKTGGVNINY